MCLLILFLIIFASVTRMLCEKKADKDFEKDLRKYG
jgi:hypothetical protein